MRIRALKAKVLGLLQTDDFDTVLKELRTFPPEKLLKPLISCLCSCEDTVKWHAVSALGQVIAAMAEKEFESARVVMRRFMWMLNDESGGIGWGAPEAIAEACASHPQIGNEYAHMLVSYMREDGFFLELHQLQRGLMWGLGRYAKVNPQLLLSRNVLSYLHPYILSDDFLVQAGAVYASGLLNDLSAQPYLEPLINDARPITLYSNEQFLETTLGNIAVEALSTIQSKA